MAEQLPQKPNTWTASRRKRLLDIVGATAILCATAPVVGTAIALKYLEDRKPPIFRQQRLGRNREYFGMLKIRTLAGAGDHGGLGQGPEDARATRLGVHLRRYAIDELPQMINIIKGDMTLVGTRPPNKGEVEAIAHAYSGEPDYHQRWLNTFAGPHTRPGGFSTYVIESRMHAADERGGDDYFRWRCPLDIMDHDKDSLGNDLRIIGRTAGLLGGVALRRLTQGLPQP